VEVRPGNRAVVHHVLIYIDGLGASAKLDGKDHDGQPGYTSFGGPGFIPTGLLGGWAPGNDPHFLPDGVGNLVPKGALLVIQVHYHKDGKPETDLTRIGLHFCRTTVDKRVAGGFAINWMFQIPPGDKHYEVTAQTAFDHDMHILAVTPHMHLLGTDMKVWAVLPNKTVEPLVWIKNWDFNWQASYYFKTPIPLPKGSVVKLVAHYDNSSDNLRNPNRLHLKTVGWGEQTTDEMCICFITGTLDNQHLAAKQRSPASARQISSSLHHRALRVSRR
ncbi:MAG TPA: hypothetical protein VGS41_17165, partial [Chthonomonadales bacterium]|nr:hypothetical protein [Chthonomonadales bacterium]